MPAAFDACVKGGGRVWTEKLSKGRYRHICSIKGKKFLGHVKTKKKESK